MIDGVIHEQVGSPRLIVDVASGEVVERIDYDEFGNVLDDSNPGFQPFGFAGGLYDRTLNLIRFGARDYDPTLGRWPAKDALGFAGGDSSVYNYVHGDPVNFITALGAATGTRSATSCLPAGARSTATAALSGSEAPS